MTIFASLPLVVTTDATGPLFGFDKVDIDSDLFVPVDAGHVSGPSQPGGVPIPWLLAKRARKFTASLFGAPIFSGTVERKNKGKREGRLELELYSTAKALFDCPPLVAIPARVPGPVVPVPDPVAGMTVLKRLSVPAGTLAQIATAAAGSLGVAVAPGAPAFTPRLDAVSAGDTTTCWQLLEPLAKQAGATLWVDELGILHVDKLATFYLLPPVDKLLCLPGGAGQANNVLDYRLLDDTTDRFSHVVVKGNGAQRAQHGNAATGLLSVPAAGQMIDPALVARGAYRPLVIADGTARNTLQATNAAIREAAMRQVRGTKIEVDLYGWTTSTGIPWRVTQMVAAAFPEDGIAGLFFVAGRRFTRDKQSGTRTRLTLIEPGVLT